MSVIRIITKRFCFCSILGRISFSLFGGVGRYLRAFSILLLLLFFLSSSLVHSHPCLFLSRNALVLGAVAVVLCFSSVSFRSNSRHLLACQFSLSILLDLTNIGRKKRKKEGSTLNRRERGRDAKKNTRREKREKIASARERERESSSARLAARIARAKDLFLHFTELFC